MKVIPQLPPNSAQYVFSRPQNAHPALPVHLELVMRRYKHYQDEYGKPTDRVREIEHRHWIGSYATLELAQGAKAIHLAEHVTDNKLLPDRHA